MPSPPDANAPSEPPEGENEREFAPPTVLDEIRRARKSDSPVKAIVTRVLGLVVIAIAVWIVRQNVSWSDTLRIERTEKVTVEIEGTIVGDWRAESASFEVDEDEDVAALLRTGGFDVDVASAAHESVRAGNELELSAGRVTLPGGGIVFAVERTDDLATARVAEVHRIDWRPGMVRALREVRVAELLPAIGFLIIASLTVVTRWWRLLNLIGCTTRWYDSFRFTYTGLFFNTVVPGINGGDVARAYAVIRNHPDRRGDALMTVVVDRALGLFGMIVVGTALVLTTDDRLDALKLPVALFCAALVTGGVLFFLPPLRRALKFEERIAKLPQGERLLRLDAGARTLLRHPGEVVFALVLSFGNHALNGMAVFAAASALGSGLGFHDWVTTMAIANTLAAVPISPGGLGVGEVLFGSLAEVLGSSYAIGVATCLVYRLCTYALSLLGGLVMMLPAGGGDARHEKGAASPSV